MILDTTVFVDLLRGDMKTRDKIRMLEEMNVQLSTTAITTFELLQDTHKYTEEQLQVVLDILESFQVLSLDHQAAKSGGLMHAHLHKDGNIIDAEDCMIAGIVKMSHETLLTRNVKHFARIKELKIESY